MAMRVLVAALLLFGIGVAPVRAACLANGRSTSFQVSGEIARPTVFDLKRLQRFSPAEENVTYFAMGSVVSESFTGALLWDVLNLPPAGPIKVNAKIKNDILHKIIVVNGCDGYQSVFGAGEIDPFFGGSQIMVAYATGGESLGPNGFARIVAPGDKAGGRFVSIIDKIEIKDAGK